MSKSIREVCEILGITRRTLSAWIRTGKAAPTIHSIGARHFYEFSDEEVTRIKRHLNKHWHPGDLKFKPGGDQ